ncbi:DegT/DnrJ/EryC1/StrS family aminotransferase [Candidatus Nitrosotenuis sp. DW1]|uniref:DegT/DnrJ/EryC1/StrS family aminotransferase n=1 Tax=Candidatus Nitrosotenuis sp. DW1 TaxID=2259672 RepID=UPI0015C83659|nr:DegT/DnrJ/EryC1/StrS family aminotransferase [Candidatus Nitrosotenuis sp. DW1]QLH09841.1 pyridoxal-5'-phosphate-dependent protein [Candidatus Nitrosotenuis sp. DW1]
MTIPVNIPIIGKEEISEVVSVMKKGALTSAANLGGKNVQEFEKLVSSFVKSKYAIAVNSGTAALQAALYALDIKSGDEVLLPSFTFVATANAVVSVGAKPIFVDIRRDNYTMDPTDLGKKVTKKSKVIIPVHLYGNVAHMDEISEIARKHNLHIIEDAAQSMGSSYKGKQTGTFSELGCFSLYAAKVMTSGEGGVIVTSNKSLREKLLMIRNHGMVHGYDTRILGLNFRLPEINAAIAKIQMKKLPKFLLKRKKNAEILTDLLSGLDLILPQKRKYEEVNWYLYTVATKLRDRIMKGLNSNGIGAAIYYSTPVHKTPYYGKKINLPVTDWAARSVLSLPVQPMVTEDNLKLTARTIRSALT